MLIKYNLEIEDSEVKKEIIRMTNQMWKLIPMRENDEDWQNQLETVIVDIAGKGELFFLDSHFLQLLSKLEGLRKVEVDFVIYRKIIFECINLLNGLQRK